MNNIDNILDSLKGQQPEIENPEELTDWIIDSLPTREEERTETLKIGATNNIVASTGKVVIAIRTISTIAAIWLVALFTYNYLIATNPHPQRDENYTYKCMNIAHGSTQRDVRTCYLGKQKHNNLSYSQLKRLLNENN